MAKRSRLIKLDTYQHKHSGIQARSLNQRVLDKWLHDPLRDIVIAVGPAGTGKTLLACDRGMMAFRKGLYEKIESPDPVDFGGFLKVGHFPKTYYF